MAQEPFSRPQPQTCTQISGPMRARLLSSTAWVLALIGRAQVFPLPELDKRRPPRSLTHGALLMVQVVQSLARAPVFQDYVRYCCMYQTVSNATSWDATSVFQHFFHHTWSWQSVLFSVFGMPLCTVTQAQTEQKLPRPHLMEIISNHQDGVC